MAPKTRYAFPAGFLLLSMVAISVYWPAIKCGLLSDDWGLAYSYPFSFILRSFRGHWWGGGEGTFYRPLSRVFLWSEGRVFGYGGLWQHLVSMTLFFGTAFAVARTARRFWGDTAGIVCAAAILLNPLNSETVSWISSQTDLLAGLFMTFSFIVVLRAPGELKTLHLAASGGFAILAYLSKDSSSYLGPLFVVYGLGVFLLCGRQAVAKHRRFWVLMGIQLFLWVAYLAARKVLLGSISPVDDNYVPPYGWLWHRMLIMLTILREYVGLLIGWYTEGQTIQRYGPSMLWLALLTAGLLAYVLARRDYIVLAIVLAILATLTPLLLAENPYLYGGAIQGSRRFFYNSNLLIGVLAGLLAARGTAGHGDRPATGSGALLLGFLVLVHFATRTSANAVQWQRAAAERDRFQREVTALIQGATKPVLVIYSLPDHIEEAYIFRSGIGQFIWLHFPSAEFIDDKKLTPQQIDQAATYVKIEYRGEDNPIAEPFTELRKVQQNLQILRQGAAKKEPLSFDFEKKQYPQLRIVQSADIQRIDDKNTPLLIGIIGRDPWISVQWPAGASPVAYSKFKMRFEYLGIEAKPAAPGTEKFQFFWKSPTQGMENLPSLTRDVEVRPGVQEVVFPLSDQIRWLENSSLEWIRVDFGTLYPAKIRIHELTLE